MAYQALYRRWRPTTFEQVIGQTAIVQTLRHQIEAGRIAHAYLFCGCHGTGKTTMAKLMSRAINCENPNHGDPCGECAVCRAILNETTMDVLEVDAASNSKVEQVRELLEQVRYPAQSGRYKVYIIDEVHMLSTAAFNALLKTLEEPPAHVVFILATTDPQKLPATILSRVQRYDFGRIPASLIVERMRLALDEMGMKAEDEALRMVARAAEGAMRDAFSILDMCVAGAGENGVTAAQVRDVLGTSDREFLFDFAQCLCQRDTSGVLRMVDELMRSGREPQVFLRELTAHCRALLTVQAVQNAAAILEITEEDEQRYHAQAEGFSTPRLLRMLDGFMRTEGELRFASTPRIGLEVAALRACEESASGDSAMLMERIGELEAKLLRLEKNLQSGTLAIAAAPSKAASGDGAVEKGKKAASDAPKKAAPPVPSGEKGMWDAALKELSKTEPPLFGLLTNERFLGVRGDTYQVLIPFAKKHFSYEKLNEPARRECVSQALSAVAGVPLRFEPVLEQQQGDRRLDDLRGEAQQSLIETFGRENVQIEEGKEQAGGE
ncbi:MAG: DNA polymerase III subunit gamma/tau [Clostridia bacterium]